MKHLDLGCGKNPRNPYGADALYGADIHPSVTNLGPNFKQANLAVDALPYESNFFDSVSARKLPQTVNRLKIETSISLRMRDEEVKVYGKPDCWDIARRRIGLARCRGVPQTRHQQRHVLPMEKQICGRICQRA